MTPESRRARRQAYGLEENSAAGALARRCEFVSLGCYCGAGMGLQALGLKAHSYPFDWIRSPLDGIITCVENNFKDFLTYAVARDEGVKGYLMGHSKWGGSFWHHDISQASVRDDFHRRVERFYGRGEVSATKTRVFVRAVNSTQELARTLELHSALQKALPRAMIYLLLLIDDQVTGGPLRLVGRDEVFFYRIHEDVMRDWTMEKTGDAYAGAIAQALIFWANPDAYTREEASTLQDVMRRLTQIEGGDCACKLFYPVRTSSPPVGGTAPAGNPPPLSTPPLIMPMRSPSWVPAGFYPSSAPPLGSPPNSSPGRLLRPPTPTRPASRMSNRPPLLASPSVSGPRLPRAPSVSPPCVLSARPAQAPNASPPRIPSASPPRVPSASPPRRPSQSPSPMRMRECSRPPRATAPVRRRPSHGPSTPPSPSLGSVVFSVGGTRDDRPLVSRRVSAPERVPPMIPHQVSRSCSAVVLPECQKREVVHAVADLLGHKSPCSEAPSGSPSASGKVGPPLPLRVARHGSTQRRFVQQLGPVPAEGVKVGVPWSEWRPELKVPVRRAGNVAFGTHFSRLGA